MGSLTEASCICLRLTPVYSLSSNHQHSILRPYTFTGGRYIFCFPRHIEGLTKSPLLTPLPSCQRCIHPSRQNATLEARMSVLHPSSGLGPDPNLLSAPLLCLNPRLVRGKQGVMHLSLPPALHTILLSNKFAGPDNDLFPLCGELSDPSSMLPTSLQLSFTPSSNIPLVFQPLKQSLGI